VYPVVNAHPVMVRSSKCSDDSCGTEAASYGVKTHFKKAFVTLTKLHRSLLSPGILMSFEPLPEITGRSPPFSSLIRFPPLSFPTLKGLPGY